MHDFKLTTAVGFIIFNRPDSTERVFAEIAKAKPPMLLVVGDGPRASRQGEAEKVAAARAIIQRVDWDCEVLTNFSDVNLGCKKRVSSGIDWVFEQVEEAIILEDDCLPHPTFFRYCQELLERYRHDQRIGMISGDNFQFGRRRNDDSYYFSKYVHIWGWAGWRDRWASSYDVTMAKWPGIRDEGWLADIVGNEREAVFWGKIFERVYRGEIDTWDYQWVFANWVEGRSTILPTVNLITNIGFDTSATHTTGDSELANLPSHALTFPLIHPVGVIRNMQADAFSEKKCFRIPLVKRIRNKLAGLFR
ncbi:N-acetyl-alpha-D-glucosaminyl L-malate synthase BshA [Haematospirillum sp. H1815]|uniref:N-acetyl-alpha-D-glucosaminyl L-malate synthase BshA n=1 Tax=Haematospirillum sp. H1815 TaxID=2723108 RepID=UPI00143A18FA|nr:N-acetyl-alpha-D-glucosaminyl L-malate synthase BshA [Haematospirillum sp. H1815]NKD76839.1 N-acetyl-alpha-D-glucosaminyl L-malate synthase BshA [Haematospirillum sp. H1815]